MTLSDNYRIPPLERPPIEQLLPPTFNPEPVVTRTETVATVARRAAWTLSPIAAAIAFIVGAGIDVRAACAGAIGGYFLRR